MIRKFLFLVVLAVVASAIGMTLASRDEIARYRSIREM
jgi:hypothetical protein